MMRPFFTLAVAVLTLCSPAQDARRPEAGAGHASEQYVRISEILVSTPQPYNSGQVADAERQARHILDLIQQGENFSDLAKSHSQGPSAALGGDVGYFRRGQLGSAIEAVAFQMNVGDVSGVIRTKQGFLIMKVTDRRWGPVGADPSEFLSSARVTPDLTVYLNRLKADVQRNWYDSIPASALNKKGGLHSSWSSIATERLQTRKLLPAPAMSISTKER
jgi:parvulin-like peptidyl-prolyl isomerase